MSKPRIFAIVTGGTVVQKPNRSGALRPVQINPFDRIPGLSRIVNLEVASFEPLIDSTEMTHEDRAKIATMIHEVSRDYDGFVIVHGTDTMHYTASALTFMVQGLGKPIIITGGQFPIFSPKTDAKRNLFAAIEAASMDIGEVAIVFGNALLRGPRSIKFDEEGLDAFDSPRCPHIGKLGISIDLSETRRKRFDGESHLFTDFDTNLAIFYPGSGASVSVLDSTIENPNIHGLAFIGFGAGNVPKIYYPGIEKARGLGKPIVVVTECLRGRADMKLYEVGAGALKLGAISGGDMTVQAAFMKVMYALGREKRITEPLARIEAVKAIIHRDYANEIHLIQ